MKTQVRNLLAAVLLTTTTTGCMERTSTTPDGCILLSHSFEIPENIKSTFTKAEERTYHHTGAFEGVDAKYEIVLTTLLKDSLNSVLKSVEVRLDKGSKCCDFFSQVVKTQLNEGSLKQIRTSTSVNIGYTCRGILSTHINTKSLSLGSTGIISEI